MAAVILRRLFASEFQEFYTAVSKRCRLDECAQRIEYQSAITYFYLRRPF